MSEIYKDSKYSVQERVDDLISRMTLKEKVAQLCGNLPFNIIDHGKLNDKKLAEIGSNGLGRITQYSLTGLISRYDIAKISNQIQSYFVEKTRLGIPVALQSENLVGYPAEGGTLFPSMTNMAATWDEKLAYKMSSVVGQESKAVGINSAMSPVIDVSRDPRWGRTYETYGEDQYLISKMGVNYIKGMQDQGVSNIAKHFLGYSETQAGMNLATERINKKELYEVFATPFEAAINESDLDGIMASYAEIDGLPVGANPEIARKLLRDTMGFKGMFISDGAAIWKMFDYFKIAKSYKEAGLIAKRAGLDSEIPVGGAYASLEDYVKDGAIDISYIDESVRRVLSIKFKRGLFDHPYVDIDKLDYSMTNSKKQLLSNQISDESIVLLKNNTILPLNKNTKIALIGPHADSLRYPISGYSYPAYIEMIDASNSKDADKVSFNGIIDEKKKESIKHGEDKKDDSGFGSYGTMFDRSDMLHNSDLNTLIRKVGGSSLREELSEQFEVQYSKGCEIVGKDESEIGSAVKVAENSDVIVVALGGNSGWVNVTGGEGKDRSKLDLPGVQSKLLDKLIKTGKPIILAIFGPGIFALPKIENSVDAIIQCWLPGPFGGKSIANVISGKLNPEGKLPVTIPRSVGQVPCFYNHKTGSGYSITSNDDEGMSGAIFTGGYVDDDFRPLYEFGFGLSYSKFSINNFKIKSEKVSTTGTIEASCLLKNESDIPGSEVVQLYYSFEDAHVVRPNKQLISYIKVKLDANEEKMVNFNIPVNQLGYYNENMDFVVEPGSAELLIGNSSSNITNRQHFEIVGSKVNILHKRSYVNTPSVTKKELVND